MYRHKVTLLVTLTVEANNPQEATAEAQNRVGQLLENLEIQAEDRMRLDCYPMPLGSEREL